MIKLVVAAGLLAAPVAEQPKKSCVDAQLLSAAMMAIVPDLLKDVSEKCRPLLPATSFVATRSAAMADRVRREVGDASAAIAAVMKAMTGIDLPKEFKAEALAPLLSAPIRSDIDKLDARGCSGIDSLLRAVEPLPIENLTQLLAGLLIVGGKDEKDLNLCRAA